MKEMVKAVKHDSVIFQSLAEPLTNGDFTVLSSIFDTFNILPVDSLCLWACSILGIVYIIYNFRAPTAALILTTKTTSVKASTIPVFRYRLEIAPPEDLTSTSKYLSYRLTWDHGIFLMVFISTLFIVLL